jgi:NTP pyrophosphatase (non-canonical NTP hydrolase)
MIKVFRSFSEGYLVGTPRNLYCLIPACRQAGVRIGKYKNRIKLKFMKIHQQATQKMLNSFPENFKLDAQTRVLHLIEEAAELAKIISISQGKLPGKTSRGDIEEGFGGVLFDIFVLANQIGIDLELIYPKELKKFKKYAK